jgi:hypothetical protein
MIILNPEEIMFAQTLINRSTIGIYELRDIYGSDWLKIASPTTFGARFKETVNAGYIERIKISKLKTNNHNTYEIY